MSAWELFLVALSIKFLMNAMKDCWITEQNCSTETAVVVGSLKNSPKNMVCLVYVTQFKQDRVALLMTDPAPVNTTT